MCGSQIDYALVPHRLHRSLLPALPVCGIVIHVPNISSPRLTIGADNVKHVRSGSSFSYWAFEFAASESKDRKI